MAGPEVYAWEIIVASEAIFGIDSWSQVLIFMRFKAYIRATLSMKVGWSCT